MGRAESVGCAVEITPTAEVSRTVRRICSVGVHPRRPFGGSARRPSQTCLQQAGKLRRYGTTYEEARKERSRETRLKVASWSSVLRYPPAFRASSAALLSSATSARSAVRSWP